MTTLHVMEQQQFNVQQKESFEVFVLGFAKSVKLGKFFWNLWVQIL